MKKLLMTCLLLTTFSVFAEDALPPPIPALPEGSLDSALPPAVKQGLPAVKQPSREPVFNTAPLPMLKECKLDLKSKSVSVSSEHQAVLFKTTIPKGCSLVLESISDWVDVSLTQSGIMVEVQQNTGVAREGRVVLFGRTDMYLSVNQDKAPVATVAKPLAPSESAAALSSSPVTEAPSIEGM